MQTPKEFITLQNSATVLPPTPSDSQKLIDALQTDDDDDALFGALCRDKISVLDYIHSHSVLDKKRKQARRDMVAWATVATQVYSLPFELVRHIATCLPDTYTLGSDNGQALFDRLIEGVLRVRNKEHCTTQELTKRFDPLLVLAASMTGVDWTKLDFHKQAQRKHFTGSYLLYQFMRWGPRRRKRGPFQVSRNINWYLSMNNVYK